MEVDVDAEQCVDLVVEEEEELLAEHEDEDVLHANIKIINFVIL
jgi:hypothetical protein